MNVKVLFNFLLNLKVAVSLQATCDTKLSDLKHSITKVICPGGCWSQHSDLCGIDDYASGPLCLAAMHAGLMDNFGGYFKIYKSDPLSEYKGMKRFGVTSKNCSSPSASYSFEMKCSTKGNSDSSVTDVVCPIGCHLNYVCGTNEYSNNSSVCAAAIHAGILNERGGFVTFYSRKGQSLHQGSTNHSVISQSCGFSNKSFLFAVENVCTLNCENNTNYLSAINVQYCPCLDHSTSVNCQTKLFTSCKDAKKRGYNTSGIYSFSTPANYQGYCDMETDGGGWLVIQKRYDGSVDFYRNWTEYDEGFGSLTEEFWAGLRLMHKLTAWTPHELRIDLEDILSVKSHAKYSNFSIGSAKTFYRLTVGGYNGTAGDRLSYHNLMSFSTKDQDHDLNPPSSCAQTFEGAWWYYVCYQSNLNGKYGETFKWGSYTKKSEMKLRPTL